MSAEAHFEQYLYLAEVTGRSALFTRGGFFFWISGQHPVDGQDWKLVDDDALKKIFPPRHNTIGETAYLPLKKPDGQKVLPPIVVTK